MNEHTNDLESQHDNIDAIELILKKHVERIPDKLLPRSSQIILNLSVVLIGSTGSLGSYILETLILSDRVSKIYALNRTQDAHTRQYKINHLRGLSTDFIKVSFLHSDLSNKSLGLVEKDYNTIKKSTHIIIHNQWQVNFNLTLSSFKSHMDGVSNFIDTSINSPLHLLIFFTSSIGAAGSYLKLHPNDSHIPEIIFKDHRVPSTIGYAQSKYIAERLLNAASEKTGISTIVARIGQIAGPVHKPDGIWNKQEWFPSLAISSAYLKKIPSDLGPVSMIDWIPLMCLQRSC